MSLDWTGDAVGNGAVPGGPGSHWEERWDRLLARPPVFLGPGIEWRSDAGRTLVYVGSA